MDIEFGKLNQATPQVALPPDQDGQIAVVAIGNPQSEDLRIFVDLDVMRDMEAHARSNQTVELGGVLLGKQQVDPAGQPFVYVFECLRAKHYQATKGSFKFTHDTWSQITQERANFRPDLEMVGWYHTHPGWSVFLSGMDLFICNHFFNRPLDVALVIDPCNDDRGWFQWNDALAGELSESRSTRQTGGFFLTSGRLRLQELKHFAAIYNKQPQIHYDPRYSDPSLGDDTTMVQFVDNRKPLFEIALAAMLLMQFVLVSVIAWKLVSIQDASGSQQRSVEQEELAAKIDAASMDTYQSNVSARERAYQDVLSLLVTAQTGDSQLVDRYSELKIDHEQLASHLKAQTALANSLEENRDQLVRELDQAKSENQVMAGQMRALRQQLSQAREEIQAFAKIESERSDDRAQQAKVNLAKNAGTPSIGTLDLPWWIACIASLGFLTIGGGVGFFIARGRKFPQQDEDDSSNGVPD